MRRPHRPLWRWISDVRWCWHQHLMFTAYETWRNMSASISREFATSHGLQRIFRLKIVCNIGFYIHHWNSILLLLIQAHSHSLYMAKLIGKSVFCFVQQILTQNRHFSSVRFGNDFSIAMHTFPTRKCSMETLKF